MRMGAVLWVLSCWAAMAVAGDEYAFLGPSPARNFAPIQLIFLNLPAERAATLAPGEVALHVDSAEANVIATTQGRTESTLKFETNRTVIGARYGIAERWEVGLDLPFISRFGGFLDPFIDEVEYLFGTGNPERDYFRNNTFAAFSVTRGSTALFSGRKETLAPADLWVSVKRRLGGTRTTPRFALRAAIKAPTGDEDKVTGSGKPDFAFGVLAEHRLLRRMMLYLNLSIVYPVGPITPARLTLDPIVSEAFAAELALTPGLSAVLHQAVYTSPMHGTGTALLNNGVAELGLGLNWACTSSVGLQLLAIDNVSGVESASDFTVLLAATWVVNRKSSLADPGS